MPKRKKNAVCEVWIDDPHSALDLTPTPSLSTASSSSKSVGWEALRQLEEVLPDCELAYLQSALQEAGGDENMALEQILSSGPYPKRVKLSRSSSSLSAGDHSSSSRSFGEGEKNRGEKGAEYWLDPERRKHENRTLMYRTEAKQLLLDEFIELRAPGITRLLERFDYLYAVVWKLCFEAVGEVLEGRPPKLPLSKLKCPRKSDRKVACMSLGSVRSCLLRSEFKFVQLFRHQISAVAERAQQQEAYLMECVANGLLLECECCFAEQIPERTIQCAAGHLFCDQCARQYVETQLSGESGVPRLLCTSTSGCQEQLPRSELARVLPPSLLESFDRRLEKASIEVAMLQDDSHHMEKCPFCDFVMDMDLPPEENKVFVCQAEDCGKESCRLCKEENHVPLRCKEVEKRPQLLHRLSIEESMSAALIRECPACKARGVVSRFVKTDGCNKMTCPKCKGFVCYQCNKMIPVSLGYGHFCQHPQEPGKGCKQCKKCPLWSGSDAQLEAEERARVERAGLEADNAYRGAHGAGELREQLHVIQDARSARARAEATIQPQPRVIPRGFYQAQAGRVMEIPAELRVENCVCM